MIREAEGRKKGRKDREEGNDGEAAQGEGKILLTDREGG